LPRPRAAFQQIRLKTREVGRTYKPGPTLRSTNVAVALPEGRSTWPPAREPEPTGWLGSTRAFAVKASPPFSNTKLANKRSSRSRFYRKRTSVLDPTTLRGALHYYSISTIQRPTRISLRGNIKDAPGNGAPLYEFYAQRALRPESPTRPQPLHGPRVNAPRRTEEGQSRILLMSERQTRWEEEADYRAHKRSPCTV